MKQTPSRVSRRAPAPWLACLLALACSLALAACGQRGPLYLPDQAPKKRATPANAMPAPAPAPATAVAEPGPDR